MGGWTARVFTEEQQAQQACFGAAAQEGLFNVLALDIESTVGAAASLCLADTSVDRESRRERARGLLKLGLIFQGKFKPERSADDNAATPISDCDSAPGEGDAAGVGAEERAAAVPNR